MKYFFFFSLFFILPIAQAQTGDFEIKVVSQKYQTVKGLLKKVSAEGIGVRDYKGKYLIFRPNEIKKIKVRKRGLTIIKGVGAGALIGLSVGGYIWAIDENGYASENMLETTALLTVCGAAGGAISGAFSELVNTKLIIKVNNNDEKFKASYNKLDKYISRNNL